MKRSEETKLFCRVALAAGAVNREEIDRAARESGTEASLAQALVNLGILSPKQYELLMRRVRAIQMDARRRQQAGGNRFGKMVVERGLASQSQVDACLEFQAKEQARGIHRNIGEIMVERGLVTANQVRHLVQTRERIIMICTSCRKRFNVLQDFSKQADCPECDGALRPVREGEGISVEATVGKRPSERSLVGKEFGGCRIVEMLGQGAMGAVYKARHIGLDRLVALKVLPMSGRDREMIKVLLHEARATAKLEHPNIVQVHDVGFKHGHFFIVMQLLKGETLADRLKELAFVEMQEAVRIVGEVAKGLQAAHETGIVHRDIKPANIMLVGAGEVRIADFGLAQDTTDPLREREGMVVGTPYYMSPEQWRGKKIDPTGDLYSLGVVFYELLTGKRPFEGEDIRQVMNDHLKKPAPPPHKENPEVSEMLSAIVRKLLSKAPEKRYTSAKALRDDLERYREGREPRALAQFGRRIKCGFCETVNPVNAGRCSVCKEPLNPPDMKLSFAKRRDEFKCPKCTAFITKGERECKRCGQRFCIRCRVRRAIYQDYCKKCVEKLPDKQKRKLKR